MPAVDLKEEAIHRLVECYSEEAPERTNHELTEHNAEEKRNRFPGASGVHRISTQAI